MAFDISTAKPIGKEIKSKSQVSNTQDKSTGGFDISTAKPISSDTSQGNLAQQTGQVLQDYGTELNRGGLQGTARFFSSLDTLSRIASQITCQPQGGGFGDISRQAEAASKILPETNVPMMKPVLNIIGEAPAAVVEFAIAKKAVGAAKFPQVASRFIGKIPAVETMSDAVSIGVAQAVNEFKSNNPSKAAEGFVSGTTFGIAVPTALKLGGSLGKSAAYQFTKFVTGDEILARDFANNPLKYKLFGKVKAAEQVSQENERAIQDLRSAYNQKLSSEAIAISEKKAQSNDVMSREFQTLQNTNREAMRNLQSSNVAQVEQVAKKGSESYSKVVETVKQDLFDDFNNFNAKLQSVRNQYGEEVGMAIDNVINKDPFATIRTEKVIENMSKVADDFGFQINVRGGKVSPYTGWEAPIGTVTPKMGFSAADDSVRIAFQNNLDDVLAVSSERGVPLGFMQDRKKFLQKAFGEQPSPQANVKKILSSQLDPARIGESAIVGKDIGHELKVLADSNKKFSELIPKYDEAIKNYTKLDASGEAVADFSKAMNAVTRGDKATIRQLQKADMALDPSDRLLPKVQKAVSSMDKANVEQLANIKLSKQKAGFARQNLQKDIRDKEFQIKRAQANKRSDIERRLSSDLFKLRDSETKKLNESVRKLNEDEQFIRGQESLRRFFGSGRAGNLQTAGVLQQLGAVTAASTAFGGGAIPQRLIAGGALTMAGSPIIGASAIQATRLSLPLLGRLLELTYRQGALTTPGSQVASSLSEGTGKVLTGKI